MKVKNVKQRIISFISLLVMVIGLLPLSTVGALEELEKNFEGVWHNNYGSAITISNLQTNFFDFVAELLYYPNNTAREYQNPNIGGLNGKAIAVNKTTAQMLYNSDNVGWWWGESIKATVILELLGDKLIVKTVIPNGYSEDTCFGFGHNVRISGEYYKEKKVDKSPFENDLEGIHWIIEPILNYDNIFYCSWCDYLKDVADISEIKTIIERYDWHDGTVYISDAHGIGTSEYFIDKEKNVFAIYSHSEGGVSLNYYTFDEFDKHMKYYYSNYANSLIVFRKIDSSSQSEFNDYDSILNKKYIGDKYALAQGTKFITDFIYDDCKLRGNRYSSNNFKDFKLNNKWGIIDKNGKVIIPFIFDDIELIDENRVFVKYNGKYGIIDIEKSIRSIDIEVTITEIVPLKYDSVNSFSEGMAAVMLGSGKNMKWGFIDKTGKEVISLKYDWVDNFSEDMAAVGIGDWDNRKWGFIDKNGNEIVSCQYDEVGNFSEGLAYVKKNGKCGYIDKSGNVVVSLKYDLAESFSEGMAAVNIGGLFYFGGKWGFIDKTGKEVIPIKYNLYKRFANDVSGGGVGFINGLAACNIGDYYNDKWGFIDKTGKEVIPFIYDWVLPFNDNIALVCVGKYPNSKYTFIDTNGQEVVPLGKYELSSNLSEGIVAFGVGEWKNRKYGFIDKTGKEILSNKYSHYNLFSDGMAVVSIGIYISNPNGIDEIYDGKWGFIDKTGKEIIPMSYDYVYDFSEGLAAVNIGANVYFFDSEGLLYYSGGGKWGFIDKANTEIVPCMYDEVYNFSEGIAAVCIGDKWGFILDKEKSLQIEQGNDLEDIYWVVEPTFNYEKVHKCWGNYYASNPSRNKKYFENSEIWTNKANAKEYFKDSFFYNVFQLDNKTGKVVQALYDTIDESHYNNHILYISKYNLYSYGTDGDFKSPQELFKKDYAKEFNVVEMVEIEYEESIMEYKTKIGTGRYALINNGILLTDFIYKRVYGDDNNNHDWNVPVILSDSEFAIVQPINNDKFGFVDKDGKQLTDYIFEETEKNTHGAIAVKKNGKWGFVNKYGNELIPFVFDFAISIDEKTAFAKYNGKFGILDKEKSISKKIYTSKGRFKYNGGNLDTPGNYEANYFYSDQFFNDSSYDFKWDLATMSLCLSMAAFGEHNNSLDKNHEDYKNYKNKDNNIVKLLADIEFENINTNLGYKKEPQTHSIGATFATKSITLSDNSECMLVVIAVRGGGYEKEWGGNFEIGLGEVHSGFEKAKELVLDAFYEYINSYEILIKLVNKKIKLWITGYSRGSAVANLIGATFDYEINKTGKLNGLFSMSKSDIYTYCFETPAPTKDKNSTNDIYKNIFCIVNPNDFVPKAVPEAWGYRRYGETYFIPTPEDFAGDYPNLEKKMLEKFTQLNKNKNEKFKKEDYVIDDFEFFPIYGIPALDIISYIRYAQYNKRQSLFLDKFIHIVTKETIKSQSNYKIYYQDRMISLLTEFGANKYTYNSILAIYAGIGALLENIAFTAPDYVLTLRNNGGGLMQGHFPELCLAWLKSPDTILTNGKYRIVQVNCPVDIEVYDSQNNLVANIIDNEPQEILGSSIISAIDENEQKIIYLPSMEEYAIKIIATDNGKMTYSVNDFDRNMGGVTRIVNYYDVDIKKNDILIGYLENLTIEENANYELFSANNEKINLSEDVTEVDLIYCEVNVTVHGDGLITGEGIKTKGEYVKLQAVESEDYKFDGWYNETQKISSENEYRFRVTCDVDLIAKFVTVTSIDVILNIDDNKEVKENNNIAETIIVALIIIIIIGAILLFWFYKKIKINKKN
jgi:hypothetical protein